MTPTSSDSPPPVLRELASAWRQAVLRSTGPAADELASILAAPDRPPGPVLLVGASAPEIGAELVAAVAERVDRPLVPFDMEGWEPGLPLATSLRFQAARAGFDEPVDLLRQLDDAEAAGRELDVGPELAAALLLHSRFAAAASSPGDLESLELLARAEDPLPRVLARLAQSRALVLVAEPWAVPQVVLQPLRRAAGVTVVELHSGEQPLPTVGQALELGGMQSDSELEAAVAALRQRVAELDPGGKHGLSGLLALLAECRGPAPVDLLASLLDTPRPGGLPWNAEAIEALVDLVDDHLVEELGLWVDLQYHHPGFALALYDFVHPAARRAFSFSARAHDGSSDGDPPAVRSDWASARLRAIEGLRRRLGLRQRGPAALVYRLAAAIGHPELVERSRRRLAFWSGHGSHVDFDRALADGPWTAEDLWRLAVQPGWPPDHRGRALDAWNRHAGERAADRRGDELRVRSEILRLQGKGPEALEAATRALELAGEGPGPESSAFLSAQHQCAVLLADLGQKELALEQMRAVVELAEKILAPDDAKLPILVGDLGRSLLEIGELRNGRDALRRALDLSIEIYGESHPSVARRRNNLAGVLMEVGELEEARHELELAWPVFARELGASAPETLLARHNLAAALAELGEREPAKQILREGLELERRRFEGRPERLPTLTRLASLEVDDDPATARELYSEALELARLVYGEGHPAVDAIRGALVGLV